MLSKLVILFTLPFCFSQNILSQTFVEYYNEAQVSLENNDPSGYLNSLIKADSLRPNHRVVLFNLAHAYTLNNYSKVAFEILNRIVDFYASDAILDSTSFELIVDSKEWSQLAERIKNSNRITRTSELAFELEYSGLHPEGIEFEESSDSFYLTDIQSGKIYRLDKKGQINGELIDFKEHGLWSPMNLKSDPINNELIWVVNSAIPEFMNYDKTLEGKSVLIMINKNTGDIIQEYYPLEDGHMFGDLALSKKGEIYLSDSQSPKIYKLNRKTGELNELYTYKEWWNLQGLTLSDDESILYIADYITGIYKIDLRSHEISPLISNNSRLRSTDGLYLKNNKLLAIQNGTLPKRLLTIDLDLNGLGVESSIKFIDNGRHELEEPTTGTWVNNNFYYIANSPWSYYDEQKKPKLNIWPPIKIMRLSIKDIE